MRITILLKLYKYRLSESFKQIIFHVDKYRCAGDKLPSYQSIFVFQKKKKDIHYEFHYLKFSVT